MFGENSENSGGGGGGGDGTAAVAAAAAFCVNVYSKSIIYSYCKCLRLSLTTKTIVQ